MISRSKIKHIKSLLQKKYRLEHQSFIVEGKKSVEELLQSDFEVQALYVSQDFFNQNPSLCTTTKSLEVDIASQAELAEMGSFTSNQSALAIVKMKANFPLQSNPQHPLLMLDSINDPGNLGTIIRIADWYGIERIVMSDNSVDCYNPKVISSSMGSFVRVKLYYTNLEHFLSNNKVQVYAASLEGQSIYQTNFELSHSVILMGSESHGIAANLKKFVTHHVTIPRIGKAESLNVGVATAIFCDRMFGK
jgi:TrmH family RNA methyltransferase